VAPRDTSLFLPNSSQRNARFTRSTLMRNRLQKNNNLEHHIFFPSRGDVWYIFRISHLYFFPLSVGCGVVAATLVAIFISRTDLRKLDRRLVAPISARWMPKTTDQSPRLKHTGVADYKEMQRMLPIETGLSAPE